jgi:hypothetical protein
MRAVFLARLAQRPQLFPRITLLPGSISTTELSVSVGMAYLAGVILSIIALYWLLATSVAPARSIIVCDLTAQAAATRRASSRSRLARP